MIKSFYIKECGKIENNVGIDHNGMEAALKKAGYDKELAKVTLSNRPDLCEYQCNGAMAGAKKYKKPRL